MTVDAHSSAALLAVLRGLHPQRIDLTLDRMRRLLIAFGNPEQRLPPVIHVAGTNAKGSLIAFLRAILEADGQRVHSYHSPPLRSFHECVRLASGPGVSLPIAERRLAGTLARVVAANSGAPLTSFEGETAAACVAFAETPADVLLLETGLGGRLDATNVVARPLLTVLTPIDIDHSEFLGGTLSEIAAEKAGILKAGVPCVAGRQHPESLDRLRTIAAGLGVPMSEHGQDWDAYEQHGRLVYQDESGLLDLPLPNLAGRHQIDNAGLAVAAALRMGQLAPSEAAIVQGLRHADWPGRLQRLPRNGLCAVLPEASELWLDGGHNAAAAAAIAQAMAEMEERAPKPLHLVLGMLQSKRLDTYLKPFRGVARSITGIGLPDVTRAYAGPYAPDDIVRAAEAQGIYSQPAPGLSDALAAIAVRANAKPVRVLICGSLHLAGSALAADASAVAAAKRTGLANGG